MKLTKQHINAARAITVAIVATVSLGACATYKDEFATINSRLDQLDVRCRALPRVPSPPTSRRSRPTSVWTRSKAAYSSLKGTGRSQAARLIAPSSLN